MTTPPRICVFCGSRPGASPAIVETARELGTALAGAGLGLVFGAGGEGVMGAVSDAVLRAGGEAIGVIPSTLWERESGRDDLTELHVVADMHERKGMMHDLSAAFVTLPGGLGTFEEFFEVLTWAQLGIHDKPVILFDVDGYFTPLIDMIDHAVEQGFVSEADRALVVVATTVDEVLAALPRG